MGDALSFGAEGATPLRCSQGWEPRTYCILQGLGLRSVPPTLSHRTRKDGHPLLFFGEFPPSPAELVKPLKGPVSVQSIDSQRDKFSESVLRLPPPICYSESR